MIKANKSLSVLVICILAVSTVMMAQPANAQSIPKPAVPHFSIKMADHSYDIPSKTTTTIDPYTNKTVTTTTPSYHVRNVTIDLTIRNQAFPSTVDGNSSNLYYNIRTKGHYGQEWQSRYYFPDDSFGSAEYHVGLPVQSNSEYTTISLPLSYKVDDEVDFQVKAVLGYQYAYSTYFYGQTTHILPMGIETFYYQASDWSPTQTFKVSDTSLSNSPTPTPTAHLPTTTNASNNFPMGNQQLTNLALIVVAVILALLAVGLVLRCRRVKA